jgi:stage V sporulation protein AB
MNGLFTGFVAAFIGLAGGIAVGSGMVAFLVVLDIIPRLAQITRSFHRIKWFEWAIICGTVFWTLIDFYDVTFHAFPLSASVFGLFSGAFVGMLAAGLTEVLNVFPILAKRLGMKDIIVWLLMAMVFGKITGSLFHWLYYIDL